MINLVSKHKKNKHRKCWSMTFMLCLSLCAIHFGVMARDVKTRVGPGGHLYIKIDDYSQIESDAQQKCYDHAASLPYHDGSCKEPTFDLFYEHGNAIVGNSTYLANFHFRLCEKGTQFVEGQGCVQEEEKRSCEIVAGNPINTATGSKYHTENIAMGGEGFDVGFHYTSRYLVAKDGKKIYNHLAPGWNISVFSEIGAITQNGKDTYVDMIRPNGRRIRYEKNNGQWSSVLKNNNQLLEKSDGSGWEYITPDAVEHYEFVNSSPQKSLLSAKHFYNGDVLTYSRPANTQTIITNQFGQSITFNKAHGNPVGFRIHEIVHSDGRIWRLGYDNKHNFKTITYPDNTIKRFYYEDSHHRHALTGMTHRYDLSGTTDEENQRFSTYEYDFHASPSVPDRRVIKEWHHAKDAQGNPIKVEELSIEYHDDNTRTITNSRGNESTYTVAQVDQLWEIQSIVGPGCASCSNNNSSFVYYDESNNEGNPYNNHNIKSKTVDGTTTVYGDYDHKGQYGYKIEAYNTAEARRTDYTYDARFINKPLSIIEPSIQNCTEKIQFYAYDDDGQMTNMTVSGGFEPIGTPVSSSTAYQYDGPFNQLSHIHGPVAGTNDITLYEYHPDTEGQGHNRGRLRKVTNAVGVVLRDSIQYTATGKILSEDQPNGVSTHFDYYPGNDRLKTISHSDGVKTISTEMTYLDSGEVKTITRHHNTSDPNTLTFEYGDARRLIGVTDGLGNRMSYTLDSEGNQLFEEVFDPSGNLKKVIGQVFDAYDHIERKTQSGISSHFEYGSDGLLYGQTNGNNVLTEYDYDALNRLKIITQDADSSGLPTSNTITQFEYNTADQVKKVIDANGHETIYDYDDLGNLLKLTSPDTGVDSFTYDGAGNIKSKVNAKGDTTHFTYDLVNRPTHIDYPGADLDVTFTYDQNPNGLNRLSSFADSKSLTAFTYDAFGNVTDKSQTVHAVISGYDVTVAVSYQYDEKNRIETMTYPSGLVLTYAYDKLDRVTQISTVINGQTIDLVGQVSYLPMGPLHGMQLGNGLNYSASYDTGYRLNSYQYGGVPHALSAVYSYDGNHNITGIIRESTADNKNYQYDKLDRITFDSDGSLNYTYDQLGNRTSVQTGQDPAEVYQYDPNSNRLTAVAGTARVYDQNGNTVAVGKGEKNYVYNKANRLSQVGVDKMLRAQYHYNGSGQRVHKKKFKANGQLNADFIYLYNQQGQLVHESRHKNNTHIWDRETIWLNDRPVAQLRTTYTTGPTPETQIYYILSDHLNTPRKVTDDGGVVLWSWDSDAFGLTAANDDVDGDGQKFPFHLRFPGQFFDNESGEHHNYFRDYEPSTGRYLQSDPIGLDGGGNTYGYSKGNPLSFFDPLGLFYIYVCKGYEPTQVVSNPHTGQSFGGKRSCTGWEKRWIPDYVKIEKCESRCFKLWSLCKFYTDIPFQFVTAPVKNFQKLMLIASGGASALSPFEKTTSKGCDIGYKNCRAKCNDCEP